jgi:glycosyltransferase involved in cell wall biosynthesis
MVHNRYQQRGGEDSVYEAEVDLLRSRGHEVATFERDNSSIPGMGRLRLAADTVWARDSAHDFAQLCASFHPDVVHCHNTFPLVSPAIYWSAARARLPVVQTLHNFRLACVQGMFLRDGRVCEDCLGSGPWRGVVRGCYRHSVAQSAVLGASLAVHRALGTYSSKVTRYIALNEFTRTKFIEAGLPEEKIVVKPNFVDIQAAPRSVGAGGLFVGRLSEEKGVKVLAEALASLGGTVDLEVIGAGPGEAYLRGVPGVRLRGWQGQEEIVRRMRAARYLLLPSIWYENAPRTLVEAFACGLPVLASRLGALETLVVQGVTGLLFEPASASALAEAIRWAEARPAELGRMGENAAAEYRRSYTPEVNYRALMSIYQEAAASVSAPAERRRRASVGEKP